MAHNHVKSNYLFHGSTTAWRNTYGGELNSVEDVGRNIGMDNRPSNGGNELKEE